MCMAPSHRNAPPPQSLNNRPASSLLMNRTQWRRSLLGAKVVFLGIAACSSTPSPSMDTGAASAVTYYRDVKPILDAKCTQCHTSGGIAPFALETINEVNAHRTEIVSATASRVMPPWPPNDACATYTGDRSLTDDQIATLAAWSSGGAEAGDPSTFSALPKKSDGMSRVDRTLSNATAYTPQKRPDDYRCFLLDWNETSSKFITGFGAQPGHASIVHHVLAFAIEPADVPTFQKFDDDEAGPGYTCFGGPSASGAASTPVRQIGGWAPGSTGKDFPSGTGIRVDAGSKIVMQVHYNTLSADPAPDQTSLAIEVADSVEKEAFVVPWADPQWIKSKTMSIGAGNPDATHSFSYDALTGFAAATKGAINAASPVNVYSATLHMHLLGTSATLKTEHADASDECLLDIPKWNFHWQGSYGFDAPKRIRPGDKLSLECHWNNSQANQPVVDGLQQTPPLDVNWGEGTTDEMCLGFVYVTQ